MVHIVGLVRRTGEPVRIAWWLPWIAILGIAPISISYSSIDNPLYWFYLNPVSDLTAVGVAGVAVGLFFGQPSRPRWGSWLVAPLMLVALWWAWIYAQEMVPIACRNAVYRNCTTGERWVSH